MSTLMSSDFHFPGQKSVYRGKVREVYELENDVLVMVASDRISAFDVVLPKGIPYKGQVLNQLAGYFLQATAELVPNWWIASPHPMVSIGHKATPFKVEMVVRGYLAGHAWRTYASGGRVLCGVELPEGLKENDPFPFPLITPTTKADLGVHDEDISKEDILSQGIVSPEDYAVLEDYTLKLFARGQEMAKERGLLLVDTKYEFGKLADGTIVLIDEIHTPDSSRYFYADGYAERQAKNEQQQQLSKEFVRQWLIANGFQGKTGQVVPEMTDAYVQTVSDRYIQLFQHITGSAFHPHASGNLSEEILEKVTTFLAQR